MELSLTMGARKRRTLAATLVAAFLAVACGGGDTSTSSSPAGALAALRMQSKALAQAASPAEKAAALFALAEQVYPQYFSGPQVTGVYQGFNFRFYETGTYLGVVFDPQYGYELNGVYAMGGPFGASPYHAGPLTAYIPDTPPATTLPTMQGGPSYLFTVLYAGTSVGIDTRSATASFAADQTLQSYNFSATEAPQVGTMTTVEASGSQTVQIGRWTNGNFAGRFYSLADDTHTFSLNANQGFHYAIAAIPETLPCSGTRTYKLEAATRPTLDDGSATTGSLDQLTASVTFNGAAAPLVSVTGAVSIDGQSRAFSGSQAGFNANWKSFFINGITSSTPGISNASLHGVIGGADANQLGIVISGLQSGGAFTKGVRVAARMVKDVSNTVACS